MEFAVILNAVSSALEAGIMYFVYVLLDQENMLPPWKLAVYLFSLTTLAVVLDHYHVHYHVLFLLLLTVILMRPLSKKKWKKIVFDVVVAFGFVMLYEMCMTLLLGNMQGGIKESQLSVLLVLALSLILFIVLSRLNRFSRWISDRYKKHKEIIFWIAGNVFIILLFMINMFHYQEEIFWQYQGSILLLLVINYGVNVVVLISIVRRKQHESKAKADQESSQTAAAIIDQLAKNQHEFKNQLNTIIGLAHTTLPEKSAESIIQYCEKVLQNKKYIQTGIINVEVGDLMKETN